MASEDTTTGGGRGNGDATTDGGTAEGGTAAGEGTGPVTRAYRTVSSRYGPHPDAEMDAIGWGLFLGVLFLLLPLLPILVAVWLVSKAVEAVVGRNR